jgi:cytochrome c553
MEPFARDLSDADIEKFAAYFAALERKSSPNATNDQKLIEQGARLAEPAKNTRGTIACAACHTRTNPKLFAVIPDLAGQSEWYIKNQLELFRSATRSGTSNSNIMVRIAQALSSDDIRAVSAYFASLPANDQK